ncbi:MAG: hypothetical protein AB7T63_03280 [Planctomycetota bacterium]
MRQLYSGLAIWNLLVQAGFLVLVVLQAGTPVVSPRAFLLSAMFVPVFCLIVHSLLIVHFIGSMKWIQQSGPTAGIDDTQPLRRAWIKGPLFPLLVVAMLVWVAVGILAGGMADGQVAEGVVIGLTALGLLLDIAILPLARRGITANKTRLVDMQERMAQRIAAGHVRDEDADVLLPESGRAGGKTLAFLGINVWVLYAYNRFVLRHLNEPMWPYAIACALLMGVGFVMMLRYDRPNAT